MAFCVFKASNWFFQLSWKEKTCLLSAANIECENFDMRIHIGWFIAFFKDFFAPFRISLRKRKKCQKTTCTYKEEFFLRNFHTRCSPQIKDMFFLFTKVEKMNLKPLKRKNPFTFLNFPHFLKDGRNVLHSKNDCSVKGGVFFWGGRKTTFWKKWLKLFLLVVWPCELVR